jgi:hypothetical protein
VVVGIKFKLKVVLVFDVQSGGVIDFEGLLVLI